MQILDATPYGESLSPNAALQEKSTNLRFPGQVLLAETALNHNYFRDYDPVVGRYVESDPIGLEGGLNTYLYASANPLRFSDAFGLAPGTPGDLDVPTKESPHMDMVAELRLRYGQQLM